MPASRAVPASRAASKAPAPGATGMNGEKHRRPGARSWVRTPEASFFLFRTGPQSREKTKTHFQCENEVLRNMTLKFT